MRAFTYRSLRDREGGKARHIPISSAEPDSAMEPEIEISLFARQYLGRRRIPSLPQLHMDNLNRHRRTALVERFGENIGGLLWERFTVHYTPAHGSWLNQRRSRSVCSPASAWAGEEFPHSQNCSKKQTHGAAKWNTTMSPSIWQFTRTKARRKFDYKRNKIARSETSTHQVRF